MPETDVPTVSDVVRRAVALVDPDGQDDIAPELLLAFEDDDRPAAGEPDLAEELQSTVQGLDPEGDSGGAAMAVATAVFLATQPDGGPDEAATLREAARVTWHGHPPEHVRRWLADHGVED